MTRLVKVISSNPFTQHDDTCNPIVFVVSVHKYIRLALELDESQ
ncbi:MAG: hypothetical protein ACI9VI_003368 [Candidatus Azotimanducaceae bacterium]|jgi:hypothetical protein